MSDRSFVRAIILVDLTAIVTALLFGLGWRNNPYAFMGEDSPVTWLSFLQLVATATLAGCVFLWRRRQHPERTVVRAPWFIWFLIAVGFLFLAIDEVTKLHESLDEALHRSLALEETGWTDRLDDVIVAGYGLVGVSLLYWYRAELAPYSAALPLLVGGLVLFVLMVIIDTFVNRPDILTLLIAEPETTYRLVKWIEAVEDGIKLLAEGVFLGVAH